MARKGWAQLTPMYRKRLEKAGISEKDYNEGASIRAARGHAQTPERPTQAAKFPKYQAERMRLTTLVVNHKREYFNTSPVWNPRRAVAVYNRNPPPLALLRYWSKLSKEEWINAIREADKDTIPYLGYH